MLQFKRYGCCEEELRFIEVTSVDYKGMTKKQCPVGKYIIKRNSTMEKYLIIYKTRPGHHCEYRCTVATILMYNAVRFSLAMQDYDTVSQVKSEGNGEGTAIQCGANPAKSCNCQGEDDSLSGLSYTFGCSTSLYLHSQCKFGKSSDKKSVSFLFCLLEKDKKNISLLPCYCNKKTMICLWHTLVVATGVFLGLS